MIDTRVLSQRRASLPAWRLSLLMGLTVLLLFYGV
jgi:hypothetical protein